MLLSGTSDLPTSPDGPPANTELVRLCKQTSPPMRGVSVFEDPKQQSPIGGTTGCSRSSGPNRKAGLRPSEQLNLRRLTATCN